jgi:hypothetical protein
MIKMTVAAVVVAITKTAADSAPMYMDATKASSTARNPPTASSDTRREQMMALVIVAARKKTTTRRPVRAARDAEPTCSNNNTINSLMLLESDVLARWRDEEYRAAHRHH